MHAKSKCYFFIHIYIYIFNTENVPHLKCTLKNNYPYVSIQPRLQGKSIKYTSTVTLNLNGFFFDFFFGKPVNHSSDLDFKAFCGTRTMLDQLGTWLLATVSDSLLLAEIKGWVQITRNKVAIEHAMNLHLYG
jgi:hypothetical protein